MTRIIAIMLLAYSGLAFTYRKTDVIKWVITKGCSLKVDGTTNINTFSCSIENYNRPDTILVSRNNNQQVKLNGNIRLDIQKFNCHNPVMTSDLRKTLKAKEHPHLVIRFVSLNQYPGTNASRYTKGLVLIELSGITKQFEVDYQVVAADKDYINLIGSRQINFSDFNIVPPSRLGGMIRTNNEINVVFNIKMKVVD